MVDTQRSGRCGSNPMGVQIPPRAQEWKLQARGAHFALRSVCIEFSGQKRIGDFERRKEKFLIIEIPIQETALAVS